MLRDGDVIRVGRTRIRFRAPVAGGGDSTVISSDLAEAAAGVSPAQRRVLVALCRPFKEGAAFASPATNAQIAAELHLSVDAVKTHLRALFEKFDLADAPQSRKRVDLVQRAMQTGLISERDSVTARQRRQSIVRSLPVSGHDHTTVRGLSGAGSTGTTESPSSPVVTQT